jgi:hypothetical protein
MYNRKEDRIMPASVVENIAEKYESVSTYVEYDNHAHWLLDGEPGWEVIAEDISSWLKHNS